MFMTLHQELAEKIWPAVLRGAKRRALQRIIHDFFHAHHLTGRPYLAILHQGNGHYMIESESRPGQVHCVEDQDGILYCTCEDFICRKHPCKHIKHLERFLNHAQEKI